MNALSSVTREHARLIALLDQREALRAALGLLVGDGEVAWIAEPVAGEAPGDMVLAAVRGDRTGLLRGLRVPAGLGLTGKVRRTGSPSWVDDYFSATGITHTFDHHISAEGVRRLLAVPVLRDREVLAVRLH
jgi:hypothetical protein